MTEPAETSAPPTPTALAAKAFMERIDNKTYLRIIRTKAHLGGWVGSRAAGCWDTKLCDAIAEAAVDAVLERFREWAAEADGARIEIGQDGTLTIRPPLP